jgi:DNA invertase Pin-like site-specific DNA recombinase
MAGQEPSVDHTARKQHGHRDDANIAVVYVRQSTPQQVQSNVESQRRQYELVDVAKRRGFRDVEVIDDDLGRSASGTVERPGFDRLVAALCAGQVGAVLCLDASRLARNGRDWHHLLELCGLVEARVIDLDGVYDPCRPNDRLLLGMKGSISEFELGVIRSRMYEAARSKAKRGELRISMPIGYISDRHVGLGLDPDLRLQEVIRLVFQKFRELGSARQVLLWMASQNIHFPYSSNGRTLTSFEWRPIRYRNVISILKNPFYAGVYAYGKSEKRTAIVDGRARKSYGHRRPMDAWEVFIKDHHQGYIDWAEYERNQALLAGNAYGRVGDTKSARGGARCWLASSAALAVAVVSLSPTAGAAAATRPIDATGPICSWPIAVASSSAAGASMTRSPSRCCAPWRHWRSRLQRRPSEC